MLALAAKGSVSEGDWLVADAQTAGRGRMGRTWISSVGNLYATTVVMLRRGDPPSSALSLAAGLALITAIQTPAHLKWPNDVMIGDAKLAGILLERQGDVVAMGFGVNVAFAPTIHGRETTHLNAMDGVHHTVDSVFERLVGSVRPAVQLWRDEGTAALCRRWEERAHPKGTSLSVEMPIGERLSGQFDGLRDDGALRLRLADGTARIIHAGDVSLI